MPFMDDIIEEEKKGATEAAEPEKKEPEPQPEPEKEPEPAKEPEPEKEPEREPDPQPEEPAKEPEPKPKKDTSQFTKEEKAEFAFRRQLEKQRNKYEAQIERFGNDVAELKKGFAELAKGKKAEEKAKTRADFPQGEGGDDAYIDYLAKRRVDAIMAERDERSAKEAEEKAAKEKEQAEAEERNREVTGIFQANCRKAFPEEAQYREFSDLVNKGTRNGLAEMLDQFPSVRDYVFTNQDGPVVLKAMLSDKDTFVRIMGSAHDPMSAAIEMHELAKEIRSKAAQPPATEPAPAQKPAGMPHVGKPGARQGGPWTGNRLSTDRDVIEFLRNVR